MSADATILAALRASAAELTAELERLPAAATGWRPAASEWSQHQCLKHIQLCERHIFLPRMRAIVAQANPLLPVVDEAGLMQAEWNVDQPRAELLADFLADRAAELAVLEQADWTRPGRHAARGPITLGWMAHYTLGHTYEHLSQMMRARLAYETRPAE